MNLHNKTTKYLTFQNFDKLSFLKHGISTKVGGVSTGYYKELNLGFYRGENKDIVLENYKRISNDIGFDYNNIVIGDQVHNNNIYHATKDDIGKGITKENNIINADGLLTKEENIVLTIFFADCVPIFFVDKIKSIIGAAHSGWKGTVLKIGEKIINEMVSRYNSNREDILVGIGPAICQNHFQVDESVYLEFEKVFAYVDDFTYYKDNKYYIDLKGINKRVLVDCGILLENISVTDYCTVCNDELFYSHRASGAKRGIMAGFIELSGV